MGGLETLVALRSLVGHRVALTLVAPQDDFTVRALEVLEPFGLGHRRSATRSPRWRPTSTRPSSTTRSRASSATTESCICSPAMSCVYDRLVLAVGAFPYPAYEHGVCFTRAHDAEAFDDVVADLRGRSGRAHRDRRAAGVHVDACPRTSWRSWSRRLPRRDELTLVTPEHEPLSAFGAPAAELDARQRCERPASSCSRASRPTVPASDRRAALGRRQADVRPRRAPPASSGPNSPGVPCDANGFVLVDDVFRVPRRRRRVRRRRRDGRHVQARRPGRTAGGRRRRAHRLAGGRRASPAPVPSRPARTPADRRRAPATCAPSRPGGATSAEVSDQCLWWPPSKVAARWLTPWLAARELEDRPPPTLRKLPSGGISSVTRP